MLTPGLRREVLKLARTTRAVPTPSCGLLLPRRRSGIDKGHGSPTSWPQLRDCERTARACTHSSAFCKRSSVPASLRKRPKCCVADVTTIMRQQPAGRPTNSRVREIWMQRVRYATSAALIILGTTGSLVDRSLALPLSEPRATILAIPGSPIQTAAYTCRRWWQWRGARWVRSCWPAGYDPCGNAQGCSPPTPDYPAWRPWGWPYRYWFN